MSYTDGDLFPLRNPADALAREVFARYGLAIYKANCLERGIGNVLLQLEWRAGLKPPLTREQYEKSYDDFFNALQPLPIGRLVARVKTLPEVPDEIKADLDQCKDARNLLTHHYFWKRAGEFMIPEGQRKMLEECEGYTELFDKTDEKINAFLEPIRKRHGLTDERLSSSRDDLIAAAKESLGIATDAF